jgi:hypothetical protein
MGTGSNDDEYKVLWISPPLVKDAQRRLELNGTPRRSRDVAMSREATE